MNFTFTDLSNTILSMAQPEMPKKMLADTDNSGTKNQLFAQKLGKILEKAKPLEEKALPETIQDPDSEKSGEFVEFLTRKLGNKKGSAFLSELKNIFLMLSKGDLKNLSVDEKGLEGLRQLLTKAGFDPEELETLMAELTQGLEEEKLTMDELFNQLFDLPIDDSTEDDPDPDQYIAISALPVLESLFKVLNIPEDKIQEMLLASDKGEKGISLDVIIEKLQKIQKQAFITHTQYQADGEKDQFTPLLKQLGLDVKASKTAPLTLNELVSAFEKMNSRVKPNQPVDKSVLPEGIDTKTAVKNLFKGLEMETMPKEKQVFDFSSDQVKSQLANNLLNPESGKTESGKVFVNRKGKNILNDKTIKDELKEMMFVKDEKASHSSKEKISEGKGFIKHLKTQGPKLSDQSQVAASDAKASDTQSGHPLVKPKAGFRNLPTFVSQQVTKSIVRAVNQGENTLKIQLKPPELGRLMVTIDHSGSTMKVNIITENAAAKEILVANVNEVRSLLHNSGVTLERFDVDMNSNFSQSMADARNQAGNSNKRRQSKAKQMIDPVEDTMSDTPLDLMAAIDKGESMHFVA